MVFSSNELDFLILQNGKDGISADSKYIWVKYSQNPDGSDMTDSPTDAVYIGIAYNKDSMQESTNPSDYAWSKIQGDDGRDAYTIILQNENISFATSVNKTASSDQSFFSTVCVLQGLNERTDFTIGDITSDKAINVSKTGNVININVTKGTIFTSDSGYIRVQISIDGLVFFKDITWSLAIQGNTGTSGKHAINIVIGNESQNISCDNSGTVPAAMLIEIPFFGYSGTSKVATSAVVGVLPSGITLGKNESSTTSNDGLIVLNVAKGATLGGASILNGNIPITFTINDTNITKQFTWCKTKDGAAGSMVIYELSSSVPVLYKELDGTVKPSEITFTSSMRKSNETTVSSYDGMFIIKESLDGITYTSKYISSKNENTVKYIPSSNEVSGIQCVLCEANKISNELDIVTVPVLSDDSLQSKFTEIKTEMSGVSSKVDEVQKSINNKVWKSDITEQINNYDQSTVKTVRDQVAQQEIKLGKITSDVSDVKSTVDKKADGSTVQILEERVSKAEQDADGFKQTVKSEYISKYDKIGARNLIRNSRNLIFEKYKFVTK